MRKIWAVFATLMVLLSVAGVRAQDDANVKFKVEKLYDVPLITSIVWSPDKRMFFAAKEGTVRVVAPDGKLAEKPVITVKTRQTNEDGLTGMTLDPKFAENHYIYIYYTEEETGTKKDNVLARYVEKNGVGEKPVELLRFPYEEAENEHSSGRLRFAADGSFFVTIGDMSQPSRSQNPKYLNGKVHRFILSGNRLLPAPGNPVEGNSMYAFGLRNVFSFAFDPYAKGRIFATENGPKCDDEINLILPGQNYGWALNGNPYRDNYCNEPGRNAGQRPPLIAFTPTISPTGIMVYNGDQFPAWQGQLFYCAFHTTEMRRVKLNDKRTAFDGKPALVDTKPEMNCAVELEQGPDGYIYYTNLIGMFRIVPA
jgi:glucose/arabinose dehydrogenase